MAKYKAYPEYKDSGVEWLGEIPSHWNVKRIKETASVISGYPFSSSQFHPEKGFPLVRIRDINAKRTEVFFDGYVPNESKINTGDILIGMDGDFNVAWWGNGEAALNQRVACIRTATDIFTRFIFYIMPFNMKVVNDLTYFTTVKHLSNTDILKTSLALPYEDEVSSIVNFLDHETAKIDNLIEKQQQLIELLKEKRQSEISHAVTKGLNPDVPMKDSGVEWLGEVPEHWTVCRLKQIIKSGTSISYGIVQPGDYLDDGVPFIQTTNISQGNIQLESLPKTSEIIEKNYPRSRLDGGEVILGIRASIGSAYVVPLELKGANLSRGVARIQPGTSITSEYLVWYLKTNAVEQYWALSKQGSTFSEVSIETVRELTTCVPPKDEQHHITSHLDGSLDRIHKLIVKSEIKMSLLRERRTALISAAVTGKIDVRDWVAPDTQDVEESQEATA